MCGIELSYDPNTEDCDSCPLKQIYGESSEEIELLRDFRDEKLKKTPEGQELIRLYYQWSPAIVRAMRKDEKYEGEIKKIIDCFFPLIGGPE